jgi:hypothetical protein
VAVPEKGGRARGFSAQKFFVFEENLTLTTAGALGQLQNACPRQAEKSGKKTGEIQHVAEVIS